MREPRHGAFRVGKRFLGGDNGFAPGFCLVVMVIALIVGAVLHGLGVF